MAKRKKEVFDFKWKLTENYFNSIMVLVLSVLVVHSIIYRDMISIILTVLWAIVTPFAGTFIDMQSHKKPKKRK